MTKRKRGNQMDVDLIFIEEGKNPHDEIVLPKSGNHDLI
jgi:hypothetical protein